MLWLTGLVLVFVLYLISNGLTFAAMYRWPRLFSGRVLSRIYAPLEALAGRCPAFGRRYTLFLHWCYWTFSPWRNTVEWEAFEHGGPKPKGRLPYPPPAPGIGTH
jgi:hypothetical protein